MAKVPRQYGMDISDLFPFEFYIGGFSSGNKKPLSSNILNGSQFRQYLNEYQKNPIGMGLSAVNHSLRKGFGQVIMTGKKVASLHSHKIVRISPKNY